MHMNKTLSIQPAIETTHMYYLLKLQFHWFRVQCCDSITNLLAYSKCFLFRGSLEKNKHTAEAGARGEGEGRERKNYKYINVSLSSSSPPTCLSVSPYTTLAPHSGVVLTRWMARSRVSLPFLTMLSEICGGERKGVQTPDEEARR